MKQRLAALDGALNVIRAQLDEEGIKAIGNKVKIVTIDDTNAKG